jgi:hypothetical protein
MAQSDQEVQDATFPAVRADINDNLAALFSQSSGPSEPTVKVAFQPWVDTSVSPPLWKIRNAANGAWITIGELGAEFATGGVTPISSGGTGEITASAAINALLPSQTGNAGKFLGTNGTAVSWLTTFSSVNAQVFTSSGTYTPTAAKTSYMVFAVGGGGGSGGLGAGARTGGGGSGGCGWRIYNNTELGADAVVTVGGGGAAGTYAFPTPGSGGTGGTSSFDPAGTGLTVSGTGGSGSAGSSSSVTDGGNGGGSTNGLISWSGNPGFRGDSGQQQSNQGGVGGNPAFWGAGRGAAGKYQSSGTSNGNAGSAGAVVILEF